MNWLSAFKAMLTGTEKTLGRNYKWKRGFLLLAITGTIASPFLVWKTTLPYQGEIPRDEQLIKATGTLSYKVVRRGIKEYGYVEFDTDDGRSYQSWGNVVYGRLRDFSEPHNVGKVYMEGFVLENGRGSFWPLFAATIDGRILIGRQESFEKLTQGRSVFSFVLLYMYLTTVPFWVISFVIARKIKNGVN